MRCSEFAVKRGRCAWSSTSKICSQFLLTVGRAEDSEQFTLLIKFHDSTVAVSVGDEEMPVFSYGNVRRFAEMAMIVPRFLGDAESQQRLFEIASGKFEHLNDCDQLSPVSNT